MTTWKASRNDAESQAFRVDPFATFSLSVSRVGSQVLVEVSGELDVFSSPHLRRTMLDLIDGQGNLAVIIDLEGLEFIDSTGLNVLLTALRRSRSHGGDVLLRNPRPLVSRMLRMTAMDQVFTIAP